ncbi:MAG: hypothetical protein KDA61_18475, partial [Planctomycetales bacterium]|nr:hypothetical protein [Planctomycetales bacterium]
IPCYCPAPQAPYCSDGRCAAHYMPQPAGFVGDSGASLWMTPQAGAIPTTAAPRQWEALPEPVPAAPIR